MEQVLNFLVADAHAESLGSMPSAGSQGGGISFVLMFVIFFAFIYFTVWRPQNKRAKEQQSLLSSLAKGDEVVSIAGILGRITKISDQYVTLSIANNVDVQMQKSAVASILPKGTLKAIE